MLVSNALLKRSGPPLSESAIEALLELMTPPSIVEAADSIGEVPLDATVSEDDDPELGP